VVGGCLCTVGPEITVMQQRPNITLTSTTYFTLPASVYVNMRVCVCVFGNT